MYSKILKSPLTVFLVFVATTAILMSQLGSLQFQMDLSSARDLKISAVAELEEIKQSFGSSENITLIIENPTPIEEKKQCDLAHKLQELQNSSQYVKYVMHPWKGPGYYLKDDRLIFLELRYLPCLTFHKKLEVEPLFKEHQPWFNERAIRAQVQFDLPAIGNSTLVMASHLKPLEAEIKKILPSSEVFVLGPSAFRYYLFLSVVEDSWATGLGLLLLLLLLGLYFKSFAIPVLFLGLYALASLWVIGVSAWLGLPISFLANGMLIILLIAMVSDFVFVFSGLSKSEDWKSVFSSLWKPSFLTSLTTVIGFLSLNISDFSLIRSFGTQAAIGAIAQWAMCFVLLPAICLISPRLRKPRGQGWDFYRVLSFQVPKVLQIVLILPAILGMLSFGYLNYLDEPLENFPAKHKINRGLNSSIMQAKYKTSLRVLVPNETELSLKEKLYEELKSSKGISRVLSLESQWSPEFLALSEEEQELVSREISSAGALRHLKNISGDEQWFVFVKDYSTEKVGELRDLVKSICDGCILSGSAAVYAEASQLVAEDLVSSFLMSLVLVGLVIFYLARKMTWQKKANVLFSVFFGPLAMIFVLAVFQVPVNIVTCLFFAVIVGLTGDNFIQFRMSREEGLEAGINEKSAASLFICLLMFLTSGIFLFYTMIPLKILGGLFMLGFLINFLGDYYLLKGASDPMAPTRVK